LLYSCLKTGKVLKKGRKEWLTLLPISGIPDGQQVNWLFPKGLPGGVEVVIDLLDVHPLPIKGMELSWSSSALPGDYRVQFSTPG